MKNTEKGRIRGLLATLLFHALLLLSLIFFALRTPLPLPGEEGVLVDMGYSDQGMNQYKDNPRSSEYATKEVLEEIPPQAIEADPVHEEELVEEEIITQETEETVSIPDENPEPINEVSEEETKDPDPEPEDKDDEETAKEIQEETREAATEPQAEHTPEPSVNTRALYKPSANNTEEGGEGITGQAGDQGKPDGLEKVRQYDGSGQGEQGIGFDLSGRGVKNLIRPKTNFKEQGTVVVSIKVDRAGKVIWAEVRSKGTTILDENLRKIALQAALESSFSEADPSGPAEQRGSITYDFIKLN